ncbi:MAG: RHS repeat-associated core domain-containing protein, partial [Gemmatimonadota bacterium]
ITAGNRLSWDLNGGTYTYDASGNMTCNGILGGGSCASGLYHWDQFGQLDSLVNSSGTALRFGYDALGRRVKKEIVGGTTIWFAHVGDQVVLDVNGATDSVKTEYSWYPGVDHLLSMKTSTGLNLAAITDPDNGTIRGMARFDSGGLVKRFMERTWGDNLDTGTVVRYHFAGAELDQESGLYYMRARYYNPAVGRFISEDPIGVAGGLNLYAYAGNDPVNARDPEGLDEAEPCPEFTTEWTRAGPIIVCKRPVQLPDIVTIGHTYHRQVDELPPIGPGAFTNALHAYGRAFNAYGRAVTHIYNFLSSGAEDVSIDCEDAQFAAFEHLAVDAYAARGLMVGGVLERIGAGAIGGIQAHLDRNAGSFIPGIPFARSLGQEAFSCGL